MLINFEDILLEGHVLKIQIIHSKEEELDLNDFAFFPTADHVRC